MTSPYQRLNQPPSPAPAPNSKGAFDPAELIDDFEHPICQFCMGTGIVRDENGTDATPPAWNGYLLTVACPRGVVFERWVTPLEAELDMLRAAGPN